MFQLVKLLVLKVYLKVYLNKEINIYIYTERERGGGEGR